MPRKDMTFKELADSITVEHLKRAFASFRNQEEVDGKTENFLSEFCKAKGWSKYSEIPDYQKVLLFCQVTQSVFKLNHPISIRFTHDNKLLYNTACPKCQRRSLVLEPSFTCCNYSFIDICSVGQADFEYLFSSLIEKEAQLQLPLDNNPLDKLPH